MPPQKPTPLVDLRERLQAVGLRCTAARLTVLQHLVDNTGPKTHAEVSDALADKGFDRATIYRNLIELTEAGILSRVELGDHVWRFELRATDAAGRHEESHPHFVCTSCGEVSCLDDVTVAITPKKAEKAASPAGKAKKPGAKSMAPASVRAQRKSVSEIPRVTEVLLKGRCGNCEEG